jgi:hypothetical protein
MAGCRFHHIVASPSVRPGWATGSAGASRQSPELFDTRHRLDLQQTIRLRSVSVVEILPTANVRMGSAQHPEN